jgi:hypothetical protein
MPLRQFGVRSSQVPHGRHGSRAHALPLARGPDLAVCSTTARDLDAVVIDRERVAVSTQQKENGEPVWEQAEGI